MRRALALADRGRYTTAPNPRVGCVILAGGEVVGEGFHARAGEPHAEVDALGEAGERARGATLVVNLEPCAHFGRTPPCADAIVAAGVARVVAAHADPNPEVAGRGFARLRAAGIEVETGLLAEEAIRLNLPFLVPRALGRPAVTLKWAMSLDGKIASASGESRWISGAPARRWALALREEHDAILVGVGTVLADDPRLDRRLGRAGGPIVRAVFDRRLRTPERATLLSLEGPVLIFTESADGERAAALAARGAEVVRLPELTPAAALEELGRRGVASLLVEGGPRVAASFFEAGLWDRLEVVAASLLLGGSGAPGALAGTGSLLAAAPRLGRLEARRAGDDVVLTGWNRQCSRELSRKLAG